MVLRRIIPVAISIASFIPAFGAQAPDDVPVRKTRTVLAPPRTEEVLHALPAATNQTAYVLPVDAESWNAIRDAVSFPVELRELTHQTLYSIYSDQRPLGLVQVRSEESRWGVIELVWVFDLDLTVRDLVVRRCRDRNRATIEGESFIEQLRGLDRRGLESLLDDDPERIDVQKVLVHPDVARLAAIVVRSGAKGLAFAEVLWRTQIAEWRLLRQAWNQFSTAAEVQLVRAMLGGSPGDRQGASLEDPEAEAHTEVLSACAYARDSRALGCVVLIPLEVAPKQTCLTLWSLSPKNVVLDARQALPGDDGAQVLRACVSLRGRRLEEISVSEDPARIAARQILAVSRRVEANHVR